MGFQLRYRSVIFFPEVSIPKVHEANMGSIYVLWNPDGPHVDPINYDIWIIPGIVNVHLHKYHFRFGYS